MKLFAMFSISSFVALCSFLFMAAADSQNEFIFPTAQDFNIKNVEGIYPVGTAIKLQWVTNFTSIALVVWQNGTPDFQRLPNALGLEGIEEYTWTIDISGTGNNAYFNLSKGNTFFFGVFDSGTTDVFESQYINITDSSTTTTSSSITSSATSSSATGSKTSSITSTTHSSAPVGADNSASSTSSLAAATSSTSSSSGLSSGAKAGIGAGVAVVGVGALVGLGIALLVRRRKNNQARGQAVPQDDPKSPSGPPNNLQFKAWSPESAPSELEHPMAEAPTEPARRIYEMGGR